MIRNLKTLGLALVAILAMSALAASTASAQTQGELTTETGGPVTLDITETTTPGETFSNGLTSFGQKVHCPGTTYTGHKVLTHAETTAVPPKKHELIPNNSTTATITPHYAQANCRAEDEAGSIRRVTVETNGCDFVLHIGKTEGNAWLVTKDIVCPDPNIGIHVSFWSINETLHLVNNRLCTLEVTGGAQNQSLTGPRVTNTPASGGAKDDLDIKGTFHSIHVERTGLCVFDGKGTTVTNGQLHVDLTVKGTNADEEDEGITVTDQ